MDIDSVIAQTLPDANDPLLGLSTSEWWTHKADFVKALYTKGLDYEPWTDERAVWWHKSLVYFVDEFILSAPEGEDDQVEKLPMPDFHKKWYWWRVREQNYLNLAPRDHAKTSVHAVFSTVWEICQNRNIRFFIVFSTTEVARLVLKEIKSQLTQNPAVRAGYGIFNPAELDPTERRVDQDWSQGSITVDRPGFGIKDPTVAVTGALTNVLSRRADRLLVDDPVTDKIAHSEAESLSLERWFANDVQPVLVRGGQELITGTLYKKNDFYHKIAELDIEKGGLYRVFVGDAIIDEKKKEVLWPERWGFDDLAKQRVKLGYVHFNRNYRNRIVSDADSVFPMIWFKGGLEEDTGIVYRGCYDQSLSLGVGPKGPRGRWLQYLVMGVDPAIGYSDTAKFFALVVLGINFRNEIVVADIVRGQYNFVSQKRIIAQKYYYWKPRHVIVESNAYQKALAEGMQEDYPDIPIKPYYTSGQKLPPDIGVPAMDVYFETGRFRIPRGTPETIEKTDKLVEELHHWGVYDTSDIAMALWFGFQRVVVQLEKMGALPPVENLIFGDRLRWEKQKIKGMGGGLLGRGVISQLNDMAVKNPPLAGRSPISVGGGGLFSQGFLKRRRGGNYGRFTDD
jgi:hypothetical protein